MDNIDILCHASLDINFYCELWLLERASCLRSPRQLMDNERNELIAIESYYTSC